MTNGLLGAALGISICLTTLIPKPVDTNMVVFPNKKNTKKLSVYIIDDVEFSA